MATGSNQATSADATRTATTTIVDRIKDMYISGGENVYPAEVEAALLAHPAILEAAVIGVADTRWGEVGHAHILLRPDHTLDEAELRAWSRTRLAAYKVPQHITFVWNSRAPPPARSRSTC